MIDLLPGPPSQILPRGFITPERDVHRVVEIDRHDHASETLRKLRAATSHHEVDEVLERAIDSQKTQVFFLTDGSAPTPAMKLFASSTLVKLPTREHAGSSTPSVNC